MDMDELVEMVEIGEHLQEIKSVRTKCKIITNDPTVLLRFITLSY